MSSFTSPPENELDLPPAMPVETEIYILPSGEIVIADLPAELAAHLAAWDPPQVDSQPARPPEQGSA